MSVCPVACGIGPMRQQIQLDRDEIISLNIFTNVENKQFLFRMCNRHTLFCCCERKCIDLWSGTDTGIYAYCGYTKRVILKLAKSRVCLMTNLNMKERMSA